MIPKSRVLYRNTQGSRNPSLIAAFLVPWPQQDVIFLLISSKYASYSCLGIGDIPFKQPSEFTRKILYNIFPGYRDTSAWDEFLDRNISPPYITAEPEVTHRKLHPNADNGFLILCSDGLADLWSSTFSDEERMVDEWARVVAEVVNKEGMSGKTNLALKLLRHSIGGEDVKSVSRVLTLDMNTPWIDDTTIVIQTL